MVQSLFFFFFPELEKVFYNYNSLLTTPTSLGAGSRGSDVEQRSLVQERLSMVGEIDEFKRLLSMEGSMSLKDYLWRDRGKRGSTCISPFLTRGSLCDNAHKIIIVS